MDAREMMPRSDAPNIFVFGDLVVDHLVFGTEKHQPYQSVPGERAFDETSRVTVAGGAANCARVLAALGGGRVSLWGLSGHSYWGSFLEIMEQCQAMDGALQPITYYGAHDESRYMTAIERFIAVDGDSRTREYRVDKRRMVPLAASQELDAIAFLTDEHKQHPLHAIIINDLDMRAVSEGLIQKVCSFAAKQGIPVLVDPKRHWEKYLPVEVTCALPNLDEWCHIIGEGQPEQQKYWREGLGKRDHLRRMAERTLEAMPNAQAHVIKCDQVGAVLICAKKDSGTRAVMQLPAEPVASKGVPHKLGPGDVLTATLALEYARVDGPMGIQDMKRALRNAMSAVSAYLRILEPRVPTRGDIESQRSAYSNGISVEAEVSAASVFMPRIDPQVPDQVDLSKIAIPGSRLVSTDKAYKERIAEFIEYLTSGWDTSAPPSAILTGKGGVGKTDICRMLQETLRYASIDVWEFEDVSKHRRVDSAIAAIRERWTRPDGELKGLVVVIDEAFSKAKQLLHGEPGKNLLQGASEDGRVVRFVLIDADFERHRPRLDATQFLTRCRIIELPELSTRKGDIPYIFAALCMAALPEAPRDQIRISHAALRCVIASAIRSGDPNARSMKDLARQLVHDALQEAGSKRDTVQISLRHLPEAMQRIFLEKPERRFITFSWR